MDRRRLIRLLLPAASLAILAVLGLLFLVRVPGGSLLVASGRAREPGIHVVAPWTPRVVLPQAAEMVLERVPCSSPEGERLEKRVRVTLRADPGSLQLDAAAVEAAGGWRSYLSATAGEAISGAMAHRPSGDPSSTEALEDEARAVEAILAGPGLAASGAAVENLDGESLRALRERRIRALRRPGASKVVVIGLDGADWQILDPLIRGGRLPAFASLVRQGARADLRSSEPMLSPLLWTTAATGKPPEEHGIIDFLLVEPETGRRVPMSSRFRRVKALWNILTDVGMRSATVAWWATWPAERVAGTLVTDRVAYSLFAGIVPEPGAGGAGLTFPPGYMEESRDLLVEPADIGYDEIRRFLRIDRAEYAEGMARLGEPAPRPPEHPVVALARVLAAARTYHAIALDLIRRGQPDLMALYYEGIDQVGHRFMHYAPPTMEMAASEERRRYGSAVESYYEHQDRMLGEILAAADPSSVFVVLSDHGFKNGSGRPRELAPYVSEKPGFWHRRYGIFVMAGPGVRRGRLDTVTLLDVAPTVLDLLGLPAAEDMPGRSLRAALGGGGGPGAASPARVATYEGFGERSQAPAASAAGAAVEAELIRELTALGYLAGGAATAVPPTPSGTAQTRGAEAETTANYHLNLASILANQENYADAEAEVRRALARASIPDGYRLLSELREKQGDPAGAADAMRRSLELPGRGGPGDAGRLRLVGLLLDAGRPEEARREAQAPFADPAVGLTASGLVAERDGDIAGAVRRYREALDVRPDLVAAMQRLYPLLGPRDLDALEPVVRRGLERNDQLAPYHNVLGVIRKRRGDLAGAVAAYRRALAIDPDQADYLANLGNALMIRGDLEEARETLERALRKDPENAEAWLGLGSVLGKAGRAAESLETFERARAHGATGPGLAIGIALAHLQLGDEARAREVVREARTRYPSDPTLAELEASLPRP